MRPQRPKEKAALAATLLVGAVLLLPGCGGGERATAPAPCEGPLVPMNVRHWTPTETQRASFEQLAKEACR